ncbi:MAG: ABC transporter permease [Gemmatimonadaceae bacterium]
MNDVVTPFLEATVRTATPLALAALGETLGQKAGVINVGLEGVIIAGSLGAVVAAGAGGVTIGLLGAGLAGLLTALVFGVFVLWLRTDQIITGTALTLGALGLTSTLYHTVYGAGGAALSIPTLRPVALPGLSFIPVVGPALFHQPVVTYLAYLVAGVMWWFFYRTHAGLALRAVGERPEAAQTAGIDPRRIQWLAVMASGVLGGLAGGSLVLAQVGTFTDGMSAGRGFIAIAIVALGRWHPFGVLGAACLFGVASALQFLFQSTGSSLPYQLFLALPYVLTLVMLAGGTRGARAPAALAQRALTLR